MPPDQPVHPADDKVVLGIHTNAEGNASPWAVNTEGHAWLTVTRNGQTQAYGLWPNDHPRFANEAKHPQSNIRSGIENNFSATENRYYELNQAQTKELDSALKENVTWGYLNNCSSWATSTAERVTGEPIQARDNYGIRTPADLANGIEKLEKQNKTSPDTPHEYVKPEHSSSFGKTDAAPAKDQAGANHAALPTGDPHLDAMLANPGNPHAVNHAMQGLAQSPAGQAFQAEGHAQHQQAQHAQQGHAQQGAQQQGGQQQAAQQQEAVQRQVPPPGH